MDERIIYLDEDKQGDTYLDAVLTSHMDVLFNGTPEKTVEWLESLVPDSSWQVCPGHSRELVTVEAYLTAHKERATHSLEKKRGEVTELVSKAMLKQDSATYHQDPSGMMDVLNDTVNEIMAIFSE